MVQALRRTGMDLFFMAPQLKNLGGIVMTLIVKGAAFVPHLRQALLPLSCI